MTSRLFPLRIRTETPENSLPQVPLLLRVVGVLTLILLVPILVICAQPTDNSDLQAFFNTSMDCAAPCFMDIRPGVTRGAEALALLEGHAWVTNVRLEKINVGPTYGKLTWDWTAAVPDLIDRSQPGSITLLRDDLEDSLVEVLTIPTTVRLHRAQQTLGEPDRRSAGARSGGLAYSVAYTSDSGNIFLNTVLSCPANLLTYWEGRATLYLSIWSVPDDYVEPRTVVSMC